MAILFICIFNFSGYAQIVCTDFTITGTSPASYFPSQDPNCTITPLPSGQVLWNQTSSPSPNGFVKHTFNNPQNNVSIWYNVVNNNDTGTINVNGGGNISLSVASGCASFSGNILNPYTGTGIWGDVLVNVQSTLPFTEVTLINTGGQTGHVSGDCNSVTINLCNIQLGNDTILCQGETLTLNATTPNAAYLWQNNSTNPTFNVTQQGTYWVEVTTPNCIMTDTINVSYNPMLTILGNDTALCQGDTLILDATATNAPYLWQDSSTNPTFNVTQQGTYSVEVTVNNCSTTDTINVNYNPILTIDLGNDTVLCLGETLTLNANTTNATYLWQDNSTNPTFNVTQPGTYWVGVTQCGYASDTINVVGEQCDVILNMPNVFTPNQDGINDLFTPSLINGVTSIHTEIYNKWGQLIFSSDFIEIGWDGRTTTGTIVTDGTYFWIINYMDINGTENILTGYVTVLK